MESAARPFALPIMAALFALGIPGTVFWPYFNGAAVIAIGLIAIIQQGLPHTRGLDKLLPFGQVIYAFPLAVFAAEHFTATKPISGIVPSWIPAPRFWVYLVGFALVAAALSIATNKLAPLAALLLGLMFVLFVALIHIPRVAENPHDRFAWAVALRDTAFSGGALAFGGAHARAGSARLRHLLVTVGRFFVATPAVLFAIEHFLHPEFIPGVPLEKVTAVWIPARLLWAYLVGATLLVSGAAIMAMKKARLAAAVLGVVIFVLVVFVYLPTLVANPSDIGNELNYVADTLLLSGADLLLADSLPKERMGTGTNELA